MDYQLENLGEDRFQELCQSLLIKEFPSVQCFPIGQPDGGRDALIYTFRDFNAKSFLVFQVKYRKKPLAETDPHKWVAETLEGEKNKIRALIPKGASHYILITNVPGTGHRGVGSIDKADETLRSILNIPFQCWWRDDVNRRLDVAYDLKWQYPQILGGVDMLRLIVESGLKEFAQRRTNAIRAFVGAQYEDDKEVRFKQVELQNELFSLFVDVPFGVKRGFDDSSGYYLRHVFKHEASDANEIGHAANILLQSRFADRFPQIVLEGAPGQGKSTITQFICQVRRLQILDKVDTFSSLADKYRSASCSIPIKVDLRDFATWLSKRDPFSSEEKPPMPSHWTKSLESFIAALIRHKSGGADFSVGDLHEVARISSFLIVLDGLDEVADFNRRKEVISEITEGISRLKTLSAALQVVITSRPTAFGPALGFNEKQFRHFELLSLSQNLIFEYANKWLLAKKLKQADASNVKKILKQKIEQKHLRDLTRNPMQLTILLSLIHTKGSALPEKRTALYDGYVDLFFDRESEKSDVVREYRELLIDLHRYLAWLLHSQSETNQEKGSITTDKLQKILQEYLRFEHRDESSVAELFKGMVERVVFLISRVEGKLEFEVQTVREYFAARHLYETAPYSPPGSEKKGTKPDRFDTIAQNPYWLNVTRFYAGCFSKGELACLADRLEHLSEKERLSYSGRQRRLASFLLRDWVFSQDQRSQKRIISLVLDGVGLRDPLRDRRRIASVMAEEMILPSGCGRDELVEKCISCLKKYPPSDVAKELTQILSANAGNEVIDAVWKTELVKTKSVDRWLSYGLSLGSLSRIEASCLLAKFNEHKPSNAQLKSVMLAGKYDLLEGVEEFGMQIVSSMLRGGYVRPTKTAQSIIGSFAVAINPMRYGQAFGAAAPVPFKEILAHSDAGGPGLPGIDDPANLNTTLRKCYEFIIGLNAALNMSSSTWATEMTPWRDVIERGRKVFGEQFFFYQLAVFASGVRSKSEDGSNEFSDLLDANKSLCDRMRYAKFRSGNIVWWKEQVGRASSTDEKLLACMALCTWGSSRTILRVLEAFQKKFAELDEWTWGAVAKMVIDAAHYIPGRKREVLDFKQLPLKLNTRVAVLLGNRFRQKDENALFLKYLSKYKGNDVPTALFCLRSAISLLDSHPQMWESILSLLRHEEVGGIIGSPYHLFTSMRRMSQAMPLNVAVKIASKPNTYPHGWVYVARECCEVEEASKVEAVGTTAKKEGWFKVE